MRPESWIFSRSGIEIAGLLARNLARHKSKATLLMMLDRLEGDLQAAFSMNRSRPIRSRTSHVSSVDGFSLLENVRIGDSLARQEA